MLVENGQIIAIDSVTTDGVTISGDGVKKPLTATPYSGVDGIVVEDFKIGLDHEHDESKWKMYGEDERNLTPKKEGSSITLTMASTITANDNVTAENNSIYVGENISAQTTDSVIVLNGATQKNFPYTAYTGGTYESTSSYSNTANKKSIEIEDIIDSRTKRPFVKEVYGKPTKLSAISNSFVAGEGNELTYGQNLLVNGFDNTANEISRSNVVGFCNYLSAMNSINLMGFNNTASMIEYTTLMGTYNTISCGSFINVYGHKNYVGNTNSINIYGPYNSAYQTINTIVNGVSNMLNRVGNSNVQGHYNYVNYTTGVDVVGTFIQSERDKFSIIRGMFISAESAANNIIFNNGFSSTITPTSQIQSNNITASINGERSKLYVRGSNNIIMKENAISSYYDQVIGVISIDQSAYACTTNTYIRSGHCLLNIGAGNTLSSLSWISNIGARNSAVGIQYVSMMGASNTANYLQHAMIYGAGNDVYASKSVIVMGEPITANNYDVVQISLNNKVQYSNSVLAMGEDIYVYQNEGVIAIATQQNSAIGQKTISAYNIKDSLIMGKNSATQGQEYVIFGQYNTAQYAQNANIFGFNNFLGSASKTEIIGDNNNLVINNRKPNDNAINNTAIDANGVYFKDFTVYGNTSLTDSCGGVQVLGSNNQITAYLYDYNRYSDYRYRPIFENISGLTGKELGIYVNGRNNHIVSGWGMMKVFGHDNIINGFHDFIDVNGDNNCIYDNVHKTILYGDNSDTINTQESLLFINGIVAYGVSNSVVLVRGYNGTYRESSAYDIHNSFIASRDYYNNGSIVQSNILTYKGRFSGSICYSNINASGIEVASFQVIQRSNLNILPYVKMNAGAGIIDSNLNIGDVGMPRQDGKAIPMSFDYDILQSDVKISNLENNYYKNDENKYVSKSLGKTVASNVTLSYCYGNTATSSNDFGEVQRSDIKMHYCSGYNLVVNSYLNLESCPKIENTYYGLAIGTNFNINGVERFDIIGDHITALNVNAGRYGYGYNKRWTKDLDKYTNPKYLNITGSTFIHGNNIYASAKVFGEEYEGEIVEKPNSTFLVANGTSAINNLNLTAFGNNIGEIQDVSSTFLIAPEGDKVFSAVASTSAGYVEHTDVETTNSGKSIVNVEYLMGIIEGLEARIQELENSHVYTAITEDNIDTLTGKGIIYINNN